MKTEYKTDNFTLIQRLQSTGDPLCEEAALALENATAFAALVLALKIGDEAIGRAEKEDNPFMAMTIALSTKAFVDNFEPYKEKYLKLIPRISSPRQLLNFMNTLGDNPDWLIKGAEMVERGQRKSK